MARHKTDNVLLRSRGIGLTDYNWLPTIAFDYNMQVEFEEIYPDLPHVVLYGRKKKIHKTKEQKNEKEKRRLGNKIRSETKRKNTRYEEYDR